MRIDDFYDVVVVGAGPSGSICAKKLSDNGLKVLLIEKCSMPRNKACTGIVAPDSVKIIEKEIGAFPKALCVRPEAFKGFKYKMGKGVPFINMNQSDDEVCYSVWRREFDYWLAIEASNAGVNVVDQCFFVSMDKMSKDMVEIRIQVRSDDGITSEIRSIRARYLVGADGINSRVRRSLFPENKGGSNNFCRQEYYHGKSSLEVGYYYYFRYNTAVDEPIWLFHKDGYIVIGSVAYPGNKIIENRNRIHQFLSENYDLQVGKMEIYEVCRESTNYTIQRIAKGALAFTYGVEGYPVLMVGEAAEMVDSMGEGIAVALESGCNAAEAILIYEKSHKESLESIYEDICSDLVKRITSKWQDFYNKFGRFF